jgi:hypothetical protein
MRVLDSMNLDDYIIFPNGKGERERIACSLRGVYNYDRIALGLVQLV